MSIIMYKINPVMVLRNTRNVDQISMADVTDYAIAAMMGKLLEKKSLGTLDFKF